MMKGLSAFFGSLLLAGLVAPPFGHAEGMSNEEILQELKSLKNRIEKLEQEVKAKDEELKALTSETVKREEIPYMVAEMKDDGGLLEEFKDRVKFSGLVEFGGAYQSVDNADGSSLTESDLNLTTVQLTAQAAINEWTNVAVNLLYEDFTFATFAEDDVFLVDVASVVIGNQNLFPAYGTLGRIYVPFGALLTHFPDDPLTDSPLTLLLGETNQKAVMAGFDYAGFSFDAYAFRGELGRIGRDDNIASYGFDANYNLEGERGFELLLGAGYINNIADSVGLSVFVHEELGVNELVDFVPGFDAYLHVGYADFFFDAEYMTALDNFAPSELATFTGEGAQPRVWNIEFGYNWDWGRNLEIAFKLEGSDESEALGFPKIRYGIGFNQTIWEGVVASILYFHDLFHDGDMEGRDKRDVVYGQMAVEF